MYPMSTLNTNRTSSNMFSPISSKIEWKKINTEPPSLADKATAETNPSWFYSTSEAPPTPKPNRQNNSNKQE